jgi:hypothetical protein
MIARATYRYKIKEKNEDYTLDKSLGSCWDMIHKCSLVTFAGSIGTYYWEFKNHLIRQYYTVDIAKYNANKELIDKYLNILHSFNNGITWKVNDTNLEIDINISKLRSVKERKINSFLIRYIGYFIEQYNAYGKNRIVEAIVGLRENGATIMDSLLVGSLIGYSSESNQGTILYPYYAHLGMSYDPLIPKRMTKKEYIDNIKTMEGVADNTQFHKHTFQYIPNTTDKALILKTYLQNKNYKEAIKYFKNEQKQN